MKRKFLVFAWKPLHPQFNAFIKACDLGIDEVGYWLRDQIVFECKEDITEEQQARHIPTIIEAYESVGCSRVSVYELQGESHDS